MNEEEAKTMCGKGQGCCCEQPKKQRANPAECTPEQIRQCHGDVETHPCCEPGHPCQQGECPEDKGGSGG